MKADPARLPAPPTPPDVDHPAVAAALERLADLDAQPLAEHQTRLSRVHEVLHDVLHPGPDSR